MNHVQHFADFVRTVEDRLTQGHADYGDRSYSATPADLIREIREELADVAGWASILDERLAKIAAVLTLEKLTDSSEP